MKKKNYSKKIMALSLIPLSAMATTYTGQTLTSKTISVTPTMSDIYKSCTITSANTTTGFISYKGGAAAGNSASLAFDATTLKPSSVSKTYPFINLPATNFNSSSVEISFINGTTASYGNVTASTGYMSSTAAPITIGKGTAETANPAYITLNIESGSTVRAGAFILGNTDDKNPHREYTLNMQGTSGKTSSLELYTFAMYHGAANPASYPNFQSDSIVNMFGYSTIKAGSTFIVSHSANAIDGNASVLATGNYNTLDIKSNFQVGTQSGKSGGTASIEMEGDYNKILANGNLFALGGSSQKGGENLVHMEGDYNEVYALRNIQVGYSNSRADGSNEFIVEGNNNKIEVGTSFYVGYGTTQSGGSNYASIKGENIDFRVGGITESGDRRILVGYGSSQSGGTNTLEVIGTSTTNNAEGKRGIRMRSIRIGNTSATGGSNVVVFKGTEDTPSLEYSDANINDKSMLLNFFSNDSIIVYGSQKEGSTVYNELRFDGNVGAFVDGTSTSSANINMSIASDSGIKGGIAKIVYANTTENANCGNQMKIWGLYIGNTATTGGEAILEFDGSGSIISADNELKISAGAGTTFENPKGGHLIFKPSKYGISTLKFNKITDISGLITIDFSNLKDMSSNEDAEFDTNFFYKNQNDTGIRIDKALKTMWDEGRFRILDANGNKMDLQYFEATDEYPAYFYYADEADGLELTIDLEYYSAQMYFSRIIPKPISITFQPESLEKFANEDVFFDVSVSGTNPKYQWQYSSDNITWVDIEGATESSLEILSASESDAGYYRCVVSNYLGTETSDVAELSLKPSPFQTNPEDITIVYDGAENPTATFSLKLKEGIELSENNPYQWEVNEYDFDYDEYVGWRSVSDDPNATGYDSATLTIANITPMDEDGYPIYNKNRYRCRVRLSYGEEAYTNAAMLSVETMTLKDEMQASYDKYVGNALSFTVQASKILQSAPDITYQWYINKLDGKGFVEEAGATSPTFKAYTTADADGWQYICVATNGLDRKYSTTSTVNVKANPKIASQSKKVAIYDGQNTVLKVDVTGGYDLTYQWFRLNPETKKWDAIDGATGPTYVVEGIAENDGASFRCEILDSNSGKTLTSSAIKTPMQEAAAFAENAINILQTRGSDSSLNENYPYQSEPVEQPIYAEYPLTLTANATGYSLKYQWYSSSDGENFEPIAKATKNKYQIKAPTASDETQYLMCQVYNLNDSDIATQQTMVVALDVQECPAPSELTTQVLRFNGGEFDFDFIPTSKSKCVISIDGGNFSASTSYTYKRVSPTAATFKLALKSQEYNLSLNGTMYFDESGIASIDSYSAEKLSADDDNLPEELDIILEQDLETDLRLYNKTKTNLEVAASTLANMPLTYNWFVDKQDGKGYVSAGSKKNVLSITPNATMLGWIYYCEITNGYKTISSSNAIIEELADKAVITTKPKAVTVFDSAESEGTFTIAVSGGYSPSYQWQVSYDGKTWTNLEGENDAELTINGADYAGTKPKFRCEIYDEGLKVLTSGSVAATVKKAARLDAETPIAVSQKIGKVNEVCPISENACNAIEYYPITMTTNATGDSLKYQWYENGVAIKGATKKTYTIKKPEFGTKAYGCEVYNLNGKEPGTSDSYEFILNVDFIPTPVELTGLVYDIQSGETLFATMAATTKTACKLVAPAANPQLVFNTSTMSYKTTGDNTATLKLTLTYSMQEGSAPSADKPVKVVLNGTVEFDNFGNGTFKFEPTGDKNIDNASCSYTLQRKFSTNNLLPQTLASKGFFFEGTDYFIDATGKNMFLLNTDEKVGTITYKYVSECVATFTMKIGTSSYSDGVFILNEDSLSYRLTTPSKAFQQNTCTIADVK